MSTIEKAAERIAARKAAQTESATESATSALNSAPANAHHLAVQTSLPELAHEAEFGGPLAADYRAAESDVLPFQLPEMPTEYCEIDLEALEARGFLAPHSRRSQQAQEFRRIKRPLLLQIKKSRAIDPTSTSNLVMVTSALPSEGKTFISVNLAMSLAAEVDKRVLLVDGDVAKGDLSSILGVKDRLGFADVIQNPPAVRDALLATNVDRLTLLPAGEYTDGLDELYASDLMASFAHALAEQDPGRIVVFDAPPLLVTTEGTVLSRHMSQVIVVVEANKTPKDAVQQAVAELSDCPNVSLLLNKTSTSDAFGYGYGYGYGQGAYQNSATTTQTTQSAEVAS